MRPVRFDRSITDFPYLELATRSLANLSTAAPRNESPQRSQTNGNALAVCGSLAITGFGLCTTATCGGGALWAASGGTELSPELG